MSKKKAITAVHGRFVVGTKLKVITRQGVNLNGTIGFMRYYPDLVDIAVIDLNENSEFTNFTPFSVNPVRLLQKLVVVSLRETRHGQNMVATDNCNVRVIEDYENSALIQSTYYAYDGLSGAGVVTTKRNGEYKVIGVHVAAHDDTTQIVEEEEKPSKSKKSKKSSTIEATLKKLQEDMMTISSNMHGHCSYCLICEVARVSGLVDYLNS